MKYFNFCKEKNIALYRGPIYCLYTTEGKFILAPLHVLNFHTQLILLTHNINFVSCSNEI